MNEIPKPNILNSRPKFSLMPRKTNFGIRKESPVPSVSNLLSDSMHRGNSRMIGWDIGKLVLSDRNKNSVAKNLDHSLAVNQAAQSTSKFGHSQSLMNLRKQYSMIYGVRDQQVAAQTRRPNVSRYQHLSRNILKKALDSENSK